jgi:hypothetical protein
MKARRAGARRAAKVMRIRPRGTWIRITFSRTLPEISRPHNEKTPVGTANRGLARDPEGRNAQPSRICWWANSSERARPERVADQGARWRRVREQTSRNGHTRPESQRAMRWFVTGSVHRGRAVYAHALTCQGICWTHSNTQPHRHEHDSSRRHRDARMTRDFAVAMVSAAFGRCGGKNPYDD